jgi:hypothetical protein
MAITPPLLRRSSVRVSVSPPLTALTGTTRARRPAVNVVGGTWLAVELCIFFEYCLTLLSPLPQREPACCHCCRCCCSLPEPLTHPPPHRPGVLREKARSECGRWDMACRGALYFLRLLSHPAFSPANRYQTHLEQIFGFSNSAPAHSKFEFIMACPVFAALLFSPSVR